MKLTRFPSTAGFLLGIALCCMVQAYLYHSAVYFLLYTGFGVAAIIVVGIKKEV